MFSFESIYSSQSEKVYPYVYYLKHKTTEQFYFGARYTSKLKYPSHLDFPEYKTSSEVINDLGFENFDWWIIAEFFDEVSCINFEQSLIKSEWGNPLMLNQAMTGNGLVEYNFHTKGKTPAINNNGKTHFVDVDDFRLKSGELFHPIKGRATIVENGKNVSIRIDDPRYLSGELKSVMCGKVNATDELGVTRKVKVDDPRIEKFGWKLPLTGKTLVRLKSGKCEQINVKEYDKNSDEYQHIGNGLVNVKDDSGKYIGKISVLDERYLNKEVKHISTGIVSVYNPSTLERFAISVDDERFKSGELIALSKHRVTVKDNLGNTISVKTNDPRYISGELIHIRRNIVVVVDKNGNIFSVSKTDPRYISGELVGHTKGLITMIDPYGKYVQMKKDDPRRFTGEYVGNKKSKVNIIDALNNTYLVYPNDIRIKTGEFKIC